MELTIQFSPGLCQSIDYWGNERAALQGLSARRKQRARQSFRERVGVSKKLTWESERESPEYQFKMCYTTRKGIHSYDDQFPDISPCMTPAALGDKLMLWLIRGDGLRATPVLWRRKPFAQQLLWSLFITPLHWQWVMSGVRRETDAAPVGVLVTINN